MARDAKAAAWPLLLTTSRLRRRRDNAVRDLLMVRGAHTMVGDCRARPSISEPGAFLV